MHRNDTDNIARFSQRASRLVGPAQRPHAPAMFVVTEADAAAIRAVYQQRGEIRGRGRAAPAVPVHHRQRAGAGVRPDHRRLEADVAAAT
jgi:hypothetical protein